MTLETNGGADATTGWTTSATDTLYTSFYREASGCLGFGLSAGQGDAYITISSTDFSTRTIFGWIQNPVPDLTSAHGMSILIGDSTNERAYAVGGEDNFGHFVGGFSGFRLDCANLPATFRNTLGSGAPTLTTITKIGYGMSYKITALGKVDNVFWDIIRHIANGSAALSISGGTSGAKGTFAEIATDDASTADGKAHGVLRVLTDGSKAYELTYGIEFGATTGDTYFEDSGFQLIIAGTGQSAGNMDVDLVAGTGTNYFSLSDGVIVSVDTASNWDLSAAFETMVFNGLTVTDLGTIDFPPTGGTLREAKNNTFNGCGAIDMNSLGDATGNTFNTCGAVTHQGCDLSESSILTSAVATDTSALIYNVAADPDGEMDDMTFSKGTNAHHAIEFGTSSPLTMTIRGIDFSGFTNTIGDNAAPLHIKRTTGTVTINAIGCTGITADGYKSAGATVNIVISPVTVQIKVTDNNDADLQNAQVLIEATDDTGDFPFDDTVTITRSGTTASVSHTSHDMIAGDKVVIRNSDQFEYRGVYVISNVTANAYDYTVTTRTNNLLRSEEFDNASWSKTRAVVTANSIAAPPKFEPVRADTITDDNSTGNNSVFVDQSFTLSTSTQYTFSVYLKADQLDWARISIENIAAQSNFAYFDLTNGVVGATTGADNDDEGIQPLGYDWYRCYLVFTTDSADAAGNAQINVAEADNDILVDLDGTSSIYAFGAQLEGGSGVTQYIVTTTATVTSPATPATGTIKATGAALEGLTNASGIVTTSRTYTSATPVAGVVRKSTSSPRFKEGNVSGTVSTTTGASFSVKMVLDE